MPYLTSWITYIIDKVIIPGREPEFRENFVEVVSTLVGAFVGARTHPSLFRYIIELEALDGTRTEDRTVFLNNVIPALVYHSTASSLTSRKTVLRQCFMALGYHLGRYTNYDDLPLYGQELYDNPETFADRFLSCVTDAVIVLKAQSVSEAAFKQSGHFLALSYRALYQFLLNQRITNRLMDTEHLRWTCEMMVTISQL